MDLIVIRHGQSEADVLNVIEGRADFPLTDLGHAQAEAMAKWVNDHYKITGIVCSTLQRARQTAEHLSRATGVNVVYDDDLMEWQNGLIAGLTRAEADTKYPAPPVKFLCTRTSFLRAAIPASTTGALIIQIKITDVPCCSAIARNT